MPKTGFCKVIAVLQTTSFFIQYEMFVIHDFLKLCLLWCFSTLAGPINDKSWNFKQCTAYANVLVSGWTWQTLPKAVSCKVIAVLKTFSFLSNIKCLLSMTFFVWYLAAVWEGQLMTSLETSTNAFHTATYCLLRLRLWKKITHSHKNKTLKTSPGYCPLKGDVTKIDDFF